MKSFLLVMLLVSFLGTAHGQGFQTDATRGITGATTVRSAGVRLRARSDLNLDSPILVRISGERVLQDGVIEYDLEYIGSHAGTYDLRDVLEDVDGSALSSESVPEIPVQIVSHLGIDSETDVFVGSNPGAELTGGYRIILIVIGVVWVLIPVVVILRRMQTRTEEVVVETPQPTLADQLEPLVISASKRELSVAERGRLELLLYSYWAQRLGLQETDRPSAIATLRGSPTAGILLREIETWIHGRNSVVVAPKEITALLDPYRIAPVQQTGGES